MAEGRKHINPRATRTAKASGPARCAFDHRPCKTDEARQIFKVALARQVMAWPFAAPPGTPVERVAALRRAFDETLRDREYLAEAERLNLEITPVSGERIQSLIADVYRTTSTEISAKIGAMLK